MKAAIYCRLSKEDEDLEKENRGKESESIQNQKSIPEFCASAALPCQFSHRSLQQSGDLVV